MTNDYRSAALPLRHPETGQCQQATSLHFHLLNIDFLHFIIIGFIITIVETLRLLS